jgi:hypothetical protein
LGFLLFLLLGLFLMSFLPKPPDMNGKHIAQREKRCPPHKWLWQEIIDQDGVKQGERLICEHCGPLRPYNGRENEV